MKHCHPYLKEAKGSVVNSPRVPACSAATASSYAAAKEGIRA
ncbi:MAG: hypothetical protein ACLT98_06350 [Eggerthellaceae bacterium]